MPDTNLITRNCAANWLFELDPNVAGEPLVRLARSPHEEVLLYTCVSRLAALKATGLEDHALALLRNEKSPHGIRAIAAVYRAAIHHAPSLPTLVAAASDKEDTVLHVACRLRPMPEAPSPARRKLRPGGEVRTHASGLREIGGKVG